MNAFTFLIYSLRFNCFMFYIFFIAASHFYWRTVSTQILKQHQVLLIPRPNE